MTAVVLWKSPASSTANGKRTYTRMRRASNPGRRAVLRPAQHGQRSGAYTIRRDRPASRQAESTFGFPAVHGAVAGGVAMVRLDIRGRPIPQGMQELATTILKEMVQLLPPQDRKWDVQSFPSAILPLNDRYWPQVWLALMEGEIPSFAIVPTLGIVSIPPGVWASITTRGPPGIVRWTEPLSNIEVCPLVRSKDVKTYFEKRFSSDLDESEETPTSSAGRGACKQFLINEMSASLKLRPKRKAEYQRIGLERFCVSGKQFSKLWAEAIAETGATAWSAAGRPNKSHQGNQGG